MYEFKFPIRRMTDAATVLGRTLALSAAIALAAPAPGFAQEQPATSAETSSSSEDDLLDSLEEDYASEEAEAVQIADPHEPANRFVFGFNQFLDIAVLKPVAYTYRWVTPEPVRVAIGNVVNNTYAPITIVNAALQGDRDKVGDTTVRFLLNTTLGMGGLLDVATLAGLPQYYEDFGQTMAAYGVPSGDYIVVPVLGPSTPRHLAGRAVDYLTNPLTWLLWDTSLLVSTTPTMATFVTQREANIEAFEAMESSPDFYEVAKTAYVQNRQAAIHDRDPSADANVEAAGLSVKPAGFNGKTHENVHELSR